MSWQWQNQTEYDLWYTTDAYHREEQEAQGQKWCGDYERYEEAYAAGRSRLRFLNSVLNVSIQDNKRTLLDIGCGNAAFIDCAPGFGYEPKGIDPNPLRSDIKRGGWKEVEGEWDVLCLHDVFEHLTRPVECLQHLKGCLTETGVLVIEMPEWDSPLHKEEGEAWRHHRPKQHILLYSKPAAEELYEKCGFEVIAFSRPLRATLGKMVHVLQVAK